MQLRACRLVDSEILVFYDINTESSPSKIMNYSDIDHQEMDIFIWN